MNYESMGKTIDLEKTDIEKEHPYKKNDDQFDEINITNEKKANVPSAPSGTVGSKQPHVESEKTENAKQAGEPQEGKKNEDVSKESSFNTLDESVCDTLKRDLCRILHKIEHVLLPRFSAGKGKELQNWDLWGPLLICLILCIILSFGKDSDSTTGTFIIVFIIVWVGGIIITFNAQFLGANITVFQSICLLGYCLFPIDIAAVVNKIISSSPNFIKLIILGVAFLWSCFSSVGFMSGLVQPEKKMVTTYPIFLFFLFISGFVLNV